MKEWRGVYLLAIVVLLYLIAVSLAAVDRGYLPIILITIALVVFITITVWKLR